VYSEKSVEDLDWVQDPFYVTIFSSENLRTGGSEDRKKLYTETSRVVVGQGNCLKCRELQFYMPFISHG
jgi:hypothetical protein